MYLLLHLFLFVLRTYVLLKVDHYAAKHKIKAIPQTSDNVHIQKICYVKWPESPRLKCQPMAGT